MQEQDATEFYETSDLAQAAFLACSGHSCEVIPCRQAGRVSFRFRKSEQLDADIARFASGEGRIAPTVYEYMRRALLRQVKALTSAERDGEG